MNNNYNVYELSFFVNALKIQNNCYTAKQNSNFFFKKVFQKKWFKNLLV